MTDYTITTDFGAKDSLPSGNAAKVIKGSEFTAEFTNIKTAVNSKADSVSPTFTGDTALNGTTTFGPDGTSTFNGTVNFTKDVTFDTDTMFVDVSENRVGIGTASPTSKLHVSSTDSVSITQTHTDGNTVSFKQSGTGGDVEWRNGNGEALILTGSTERMRIDSSGNVGIGTTNPSAGAVGGKVLHVQNSGSTASVRVDRSDASTAGTLSLTSGNTTNGVFSTGVKALGFSTDSTERMRIDSSGNVGIGTTSPSTFNTSNGAGNLVVGSGSGAEGITVYSGTTSNGALCFADGTSSTDTYKGYVQYNHNTNSMQFATEHTERMRINSSGNVGIGTTSPSYQLDVDGVIASQDAYLITANSSGTPSAGAFMFRPASNTLALGTNSTERMRIDASGNVLVGKTSSGSTIEGAELNNSGSIFAVRNSNPAGAFDRKTTDGDVVQFRKDGTTVGSIGADSGYLVIGKGDTGLLFQDGGDAIQPRSISGQANRDAAIDLGVAGGRFKDLYRSGSTYSTSDRNKKQDIRDLTDAEARVAVVAKGSLKAFRYIDTVEAEGDDANIHFGIIAQDLKAAFEAEGLNADSYQVLKTSTYTDDDGVEQTTYSVCYENLLAFIISAI